MKKGAWGWGITVAVCLVVAGGLPAWGADVIKIGVIGPMNFVQGKGHWAGATMAAEEINAKGGIQVGNKKMKVELVKADSNEFLSVTDATNAMELLLTQHKVDFIVGGFRTEAVLAMQDLAMDYKKIFIGCGAAHPELCTRVAKDYNRYKYFFRGTPFNSEFLVKTCFIHMATVGELLKKEVNIPKVRVAIVAEKAVWADPMIAAAEKVIPQMGMEVAGVWRPSPVATDVTAELSAIQRSEAHMIFTAFSSSVGIPFARQAGELKVPAAQVGINVGAQKDGFWEATRGMGNYVATMNTYARGVEVNHLTRPFVDKYIERFGEVPTYTADTYAAIIYGLAPAIEQAGTLDADKLVSIMETREYDVPSGKVGYLKDAEGRHLHDGEGREVTLAFLPLFHIYGQVVVMLGSLVQGLTMVLFTTPDMEDILDAAERYQASAFYGVPTLLEYLKEYEKTDRVNWKRFKLIACGADTLHRSTIEGWERRTGTRIMEGYGMTETTAVSHGSPYQRPKTGSFGVPIPNVRAAIIDPEGVDFVPPGEVGELIVSGPNIMQGYWMRPQETKEALVEIDGMRWLRTGDLVTMDEEGYFHFFDRKRDLIKYKGYSVFARHVEEVLYKHPQIKAAGVVGLPDPKVGQIIKAYVVLQSEARGKVSEEEIIEYCKQNLTHYKVPKIIEFRGELPKTDVGKVSRRELREEAEEA